MTEHRPIVVLIEDDRHIRRFVRDALESERCVVYEAATAAAGAAEVASRKPDLVVLDLGLPDRDGVDLIREWRAWLGIPIIILSARAAEEQKIRALDAGADDYLTKPFGVGELLARVRVLLRRRDASGEGATAQYRFGNVAVDLARRTVSVNDLPVHLTPIEFRLLAILVGNAGKVLTHRHLLREIWGGQAIESSHYLRVYVGHLRQKLERDPAQPQHIITETGVGYRFVMPDPDPVQAR